MEFMSLEEPGTDSALSQRLHLATLQGSYTEPLLSSTGALPLDHTQNG